MRLVARIQWTWIYILLAESNKTLEDIDIQFSVGLASGCNADRIKFYSKCTSNALLTMLVVSNLAVYVDEIFTIVTGLYWKKNVNIAFLQQSHRFHQSFNWIFFLLQFLQRIYSFDEVLRKCLVLESFVFTPQSFNLFASLSFGVLFVNIIAHLSFTSSRETRKTLIPYNSVTTKTELDKIY